MSEDVNAQTVVRCRQCHKAFSVSVTGHEFLALVPKHLVDETLLQCRTLIDVWNRRIKMVDCPGSGEIEHVSVSVEEAKDA